jgi:hypothetical protein
MEIITLSFKINLINYVLSLNSGLMIIEDFIEDG